MKMLFIGDAIKECRELKGLSLGRLADISGIDKSYLSKIENNKRDPSLSSLLTICKAFNIQLSNLILLAEEPEKNDLTHLHDLLKDATRELIRGKV
ncbi:helix-turn-helix domain-containing protein [Pseudoalteromonas luteoviolacea]|uniref:helix-turn-helix domain-containing protein n=1 Tax=Pseudoalteromonas luteoviolacea TaxID=43657 RepID=UPI001B38D734|nr:helix-turn-helix transcriptional regulator [Pseudoalteromonas luteoviolacea]MBQ4838697.1 helix-turn-helix transcriptional regulator [Pseudoalteromonas luteoviolacea]